MDLSLVIRQRLAELGLAQRDLARAAQVTESYVSQMLTRRKVPPAPNRTDIYQKMEKLLRLPNGQLSKLAELQRSEELKKKVMDPPAPLFEEVRALILRKCAPAKRQDLRAIFEKQPFGEVERLVTQKLLDVVKRVAREELQSGNWLRRVARLSGRSYAETRVSILEFLDTDVFHVSAKHCVSFLDPLIESWDIDLGTFGIEVVLNRRLASGDVKRFEFVERQPDPPVQDEPGLTQFLDDPSLSRGATEKEIEFLRKLRFNGKWPTPLYYYRELQNLRDPLHFRGARGRRRRRRARRA